LKTPEFFFIKIGTTEHQDNYLTLFSGLCQIIFVSLRFGTVIVYFYRDNTFVMKLKTILFAVCVVVISSTLQAQKYLNTDDVIVTRDYMGVAVSSEKTLVENLEAIPSYSTSAQIFGKFENLLEEHEMVTVFAPLNDAFNSMSEEDLEAFMADTSRLKTVMSYSVVPGRLDLHAIKKAIGQGGGTAYFATLSGEKLGAKLVGEKVVLFDSENNTATLMASDFYHKDGFLHMVNGLLLPSEE
jgi:uncharacterized surface protein with fasciclin (FAS1) repeats